MLMDLGFEFLLSDITVIKASNPYFGFPKLLQNFVKRGIYDIFVVLKHSLEIYGLFYKILE